MEIIMKLLAETPNKALEFAHKRRGPDAQKRRAAQLSR